MFIPPPGRTIRFSFRFSIRILKECRKLFVDFLHGSSCHGALHDFPNILLFIHIPHSISLTEFFDGCINSEQCFGSGFAESGSRHLAESESRSRLHAESRSNPDPESNHDFLKTENKFFLSKTVMHVFLNLYKGHSGPRISLMPNRELFKHEIS